MRRPFSARTIRLLILAPVLASLLACQTLSRGFETLVAPTALPTQTSLPTRSPTASSTATLESTITWTPLPPTATLTPTATETQPPLPTGPTPTHLSATVQFRIFEKLWQTVKDNYLYPDYNGLDWKAMHDEYDQRISSNLSNAEFYRAMDELIFRLNDNHSIFLSPEEVKAEEAEFSGELTFVGIGVISMPVPERKLSTILAVFKGGPADQAGLKWHDNLLSIDGQPILEPDGSINSALRGPEGSTATLEVQTPGEAPRQVNIVRHSINSSTPTPYTLLTSPKGKRIGYILLVSFADDTVSDQVQAAIKTMRSSGPLDGLILDDRENAGGLSTVLENMLSFFTYGTVGQFVSRSSKRPLKIDRLDVNGSQYFPLVALVGPDTVSFGEIFAGILQDAKRAYLIGERTAGNVEILWQYNFEDGSRLWLAHDAFHPKNHPDIIWEKTGVTPDETVAVQWDQVTVATDPAVNAAMAHIDTQ